MLLIAFTEGHRPDAAGIRKAVSDHARLSLSHCPDDVDQAGWAEVLIDGMTFDISGFGEHSPTRVMRPRNFAGHSQRSHWPDEYADAIAISLGPHLAEATPNLPITRGLAELAAALSGSLADVLSLVWRPADLAIEPEEFVKSVTDWSGSGGFPSELFIATKEMPDDGIQSVGLAHFIGQEVRIEPEHFEDPNQSHRLARRLVDQFVLSGPVTSADQIVGPDGTSLRIEPSTNCKFIRVSRG